MYQPGDVLHLEGGIIGKYCVDEWNTKKPPWKRTETVYTWVSVEGEPNYTILPAYTLVLEEIELYYPKVGQLQGETDPLMK